MNGRSLLGMGGGICILRTNVLYCRDMSKKQPKNKSEQTEKEPHLKTPTFVVELPLATNARQAKRLRAHFEAARCLYNALLGEANKRMLRMRADARWQAARAIPRAQKQARAAAFKALRKEYRFSEYDLHDYAKAANCVWIAEHIDSMTADRKSVV